MPATLKQDRIDLMFRAFSDRTRLRILNMLQTGETCVCDLVRILDVPQPKVSRHLAYLRKAKLVVARKEGLWMHYRLSPPQTQFHKSLLNCLNCCFGSVPQLSKDVRKLRRVKSVSKCLPGCCD